MILQQDGHGRQVRCEPQHLAWKAQPMYVNDVRIEVGDQRRRVRNAREEVIRNSITMQDLRSMTSLHHRDSQTTLSGGLGDIHERRPILQQLCRLTSTWIYVEPNLHDMEE